MPDKFKAGDIVDIHIKGARVLENDLLDVLAVEYQIRIPVDQGNWRRAYMCTASDAVTVTRIAPKNWPPQQGDVWTSVDPVLWFAHLGEVNGQDGELRMVNDVGAVLTVDQFLDGYVGRLVLRDGRATEAVSGVH